MGDLSQRDLTGEALNLNTVGRCPSTGRPATMALMWPTSPCQLSGMSLSHSQAGGQEGNSWKHAPVSADRKEGKDNWVRGAQLQSPALPEPQGPHGYFTKTLAAFEEVNTSQPYKLPPGNSLHTTLDPKYEAPCPGEGGAGGGRGGEWGAEHPEACEKAEKTECKGVSASC